MFWDVRAAKFLESTMNTNRAVTLKASRGWVVSNFHQIQLKTIKKELKIHSIFSRKIFFQHRDDHFMQQDMMRPKYSPAIYTHCYDTSGTRLFAAGGPLKVEVKGNYIALFQ